MSIPLSPGRLRHELIQVMIVEYLKEFFGRCCWIEWVNPVDIRSIEITSKNHIIFMESSYFQ